MANEQSTIDWDQVDVTEEVTAEEQKASDDIGYTHAVGIFQITVIASDAFENVMKAYTCIAAKLKMRIDKVLMFEQPMIDGKGKPIEHEGEVINKVQAIPSSKMKEIHALLSGQTITDDINLFNPKEKDAMKKRRLYIAKQLGLISKNSVQLPTSVWPNAVGKKCIITTNWNHWKDKLTGEPRKNVKVDWDGYEAINQPSESGLEDSDLDGSPNAENGDPGIDEEFNDI